MNYFVRLLISFDEFSNVLFGGYLDETISARAGRAAFHKKYWGIAVSWFLGEIVPNHCRLAELHDRQRAEYIVHLESLNDPEMLVR